MHRIQPFIPLLTRKLKDIDAQTLKNQIAIAQIPAPTGKEKNRASFLVAKMASLGYQNIRQDSAGNVIVRRIGNRPELSPVCVIAHMDTVFDISTRLDVNYESDVIRCPGICDNARGLSALLSIAEVLGSESNSYCHRTIDFVASTCEEGKGDLAGALTYLNELAKAPNSLIALDGPGDSTIVNRGVGSRRFKIIIEGPGGHSWHNADRPNPILAASNAINEISRIDKLFRDKTTVSITGINGGTAINSIPEIAWFHVDIRSLSEKNLDTAVAHMEQILLRISLNEQNLTFRNETIGRRPAGSLEDDSTLMRMAISATEKLGVIPVLGEASTDANAAMSMGIQAIAIGAGGYGGEMHTENEWYNNNDSVRGLSRALMILLLSSNHIEDL